MVEGADALDRRGDLLCRSQSAKMAQSCMRLPLNISTLFLLLAGISLLPGQASITSAQLDFWNWRQVECPAAADGIVVAPDDDNTWYVASGNGLFITRDGGGTWTQALLDSVSKNAIAIDPFNPNQVYVGAGMSLYISSDRGRTWTQAQGLSEQIATIFVSRSDRTIWVGPRLSSAVSGVYRSQDRGASWQQVSYGVAFPGLATTWDIAEDSAGAIWAATEGFSVTPGKMMLLRSSDRGSNWVDVSYSGWNTPPTKLLWDSNTQGIYAVTRLGVFATGNQGQRWLNYTGPGASSAAVVLGAFNWPSLFSGVDAASGGGVRVGSLLSHADLIDIHVFSAPPKPIGLQGSSVSALVSNRSQTRLFAACGQSGIYSGTVLQPQIAPSTLFVVPGGVLAVGCQTCPLVPGLAIVLAGQRTFFRLGIDAQTWSVPASLAAGTYQAQIQMDPFAPVNVTLVVVASAAPRITQMTSVAFGIKPQYAPGEIATLFGFGLTGLVSSAPTAANASQQVPLATQLAQSQVLVDGIPAPLYFAFTGTNTASQINFQIPYSAVPGSHTLTVNRLLPSAAVDAGTTLAFSVRTVSPTYLGNPGFGIFVQNVTLDPGGNIFVTADTPAHPGDIAIVYATGLGATSPPVQEGAAPPPGILANVLAPVNVVFRAGTSQWTAQVFGAAASPQYPGLYQIAFQFPPSINAAPTVDLVLGVGQDVQTFRVAFAQ